MAARAVDRASAVPLWSQVQADVRRRAGRGEFDDLFPGENALVAEYEVSRNTVREALRALRAEGLVSAERGRSPRLVHGREISQPVGALYSLFESVRSAGLSQRSVVRRLELQADGIVAARLGLEESTPLVHLERLRLAGEEPLALDRVWLPATVASSLLEVDFTNTSLYEELAARAGVRLKGGEENIRAVMPSTAERVLLGCDPVTAMFAIDRVGRVGVQAVEWRQTLVRGDRFSFRAEFSASGYQLAVASPWRAGSATVSGGAGVS